MSLITKINSTTIDIIFSTISKGYSRLYYNGSY